MTAFDKAIQKVIEGHEGLYSNDENDAGGETYSGISRVANPNWEGWKIIDQYKDLQGFPENLEKHPALELLVTEYYKDKYWYPFRGDVIPESIALELFDIAVNCGVSKAIEWLQRSLNILNNNGKLYADITADGKFGGETLSALKVCLNKRSEELLVKVLNVFQGFHYINLMEKKSSQEKFVGWFNRVEFI